jgi:hypothetical protein
MGNATWTAGKFEDSWKTPFENWHFRTLQAERRREKAGSGQELRFWLPGMDSNHEESRPFRISNLLIPKSSRSQESCENNRIRTAFVQSTLPEAGNIAVLGTSGHAVLSSRRKCVRIGLDHQGARPAS